MSQSYYKFSVGDDENDAGVLSKALEKIQFGKPQTHGGVFLDDNNAKQTYERFVTRTPPDITPNTRIVAVCGIKQQRAGPGADGWFLSDFFAFYHLLHGLTPHQHWMHALDLTALTTQERPYLHGSPFKTRKVVLDDKILAGAKNLVRCSVGGLQGDFKKRLRTECQEATKAGDASVLVLIFCHGEMEHGGIAIGSNEMRQFEFINTIQDKSDVPVTILSTACYSGGWSCNKQFDKTKKRHYNKTGKSTNQTTLMAASPNEGSHSWNITSTLGRRYCGSVFTTAMIEALTKVHPTEKSLMDPDDDGNSDKTEEQYASYEEFTRTIYHTLLYNVDRRGTDHGFTFSAEDDAWSMCWMDRTGIRLEDFKKRWDALEDADADPHLHPGDPQNRDPHVTPEQEAEYQRLKLADNDRNVYRGSSKSGQSSAVGSSGGSHSVLGKRKTSGMCGGSVQSLVMHISFIGGQYLESYKGFDTSGNDNALHNLINRIQLGEENDPAVLDEVLRSLDYRMSQMATADEHLEAMEVPRPFDKRCHEFNIKGIQNKIGQDRFREMIDLIFERSVLLPSPVEEQGRPFYKGHIYLVAAFYYADSSMDAMVAKLDTLAASITQDLEYHKAFIKEIPAVKSKRQKLFQAFGISSGNVSPVKRRSRGLSLAGRG
ncbi:MAG: hypothetical protein Q9166_001995 [cf. Caloplaca sp. 2 TL-2023]